MKNLKGNFKAISILIFLKVEDDSTAYLMEILKPSKCLYIGDLRSTPVLLSFHLSSQFNFFNLCMIFTLRQDKVTL